MSAVRWYDFCMAEKERRLARTTLPEVRAQFARMVDDGVPPDAVRSALKLGRSTYFKWLRLYQGGGVAALEVRPIPGGQPKLTEKQEAQLRSWLVGKDPRQLQFEFALWTRKIVRELIFQRFGVEMTPQGVGKLLARLGLSPQRPVYRAYEQNPDAVTRWKTEQYPAIRAEAAKLGASVFFADEAAVRSDFHAGTTWAPVGQTPVVPATGNRFSVGMISAIAPTGELHFDLFTGTMNSARFIEFCEQLLHDVPGIVFLIVDGVRYHHSRAVNEYVASTNGRLRIFKLPAYSPELNPDEWVWNNVKNTDIGRKTATRRSDLTEMAHRALERLKGLPDVIRGFFGDPHLAYITNT
jgi:transposase